jgi:DNA-directed RNA polymerase sigma subunit (sigma70/sigma32)
MNQSRTIRLPVHVVKELNQVLRTQRQLEAASNGDTTVEDVARRLDRSGGGRAGHPGPQRAHRVPRCSARH